MVWLLPWCWWADSLCIFNYKESATVDGSLPSWSKNVQNFSCCSLWRADVFTETGLPKDPRCMSFFLFFGIDLFNVLIYQQLLHISSWHPHELQVITVLWLFIHCQIQRIIISHHFTSISGYFQSLQDLLAPSFVIVTEVMFFSLAMLV